MGSKTVCEQYIEWATEALQEWDGLNTHELFTLIAEKTGEEPHPVFANDRKATENERHLLNLLSWRESEARQMKAEIAALKKRLQDRP